MESPVMTSASSHRLRSAVSACAQPTHSYLNSSYLGSSIQSESHHSGGCFKKFNNSGKNCDSSLLDKLNITKKSQPSTDYSIFHKRHKPCSKNSLNHCCATKIHHKAKHNEKEVTGGVLNLIPKQFVVGNDLFSKIQLNGNLLDSKKLGNFPTEGNESGDKVKSNHKGSSINKKNINGSCTGTKVLNNKYSNCEKSKSKKNLEVSVFGKQESINFGSELSDECPTHCNLVDLGEEIRSQERQEISKWEPKHVITRRTAQIVREIQNVWRRRLGSSEVTLKENIKHLFNDLNLFPTPTEVSEMLECAKESTENSSLVTINDFYKYCNSFTRNKGYKVPQSSLLSSNEKHVDILKRKFSKDMGKYEVFLGGSCNPTTWRNDIAIPELESMGISYYNPQQVDEWRPELLEVEYHAKENATVMFFVIDNQTRGVSALIEVAHLAGNRRQLILVIQSYTQINQTICNEEISEEEYKDLTAGQEVLQDLVESQGIPVFVDIKVALKRTEEILRRNLTLQDLREPVSDSKKFVLNCGEVFEKLDSENSGEINIFDICLGLKMLTKQNVSVEHIKNLIGNQTNENHIEDIMYNFETFSELYDELIRKQKEGIVLSSPSFKVCRDVYLGGTIENTFWRESVAIPLLQSHNLSYFVPKISDGPKRFPDIEAVAMENSFLLLFVITSTARSIAAMAIAGHYIGKGANVVLCVQHLPEDVTIGSERLSECAVKDYNRGRMYLMDIAKRNGVPVFDETSTVVNYVIQKCTERRKANQ